MGLLQKMFLLWLWETTFSFSHACHPSPLSSLVHVTTSFPGLVPLCLHAASLLSSVASVGDEIHQETLSSSTCTSSLCQDDTSALSTPSTYFGNVAGAQESFCKKTRGLFESLNFIKLHCSPSLPVCPLLPPHLISNGSRKNTDTGFPHRIGCLGQTRLLGVSFHAFYQYSNGKASRRGSASENGMKEKGRCDGQPCLALGVKGPDS